MKQSPIDAIRDAAEQATAIELRDAIHIINTEMWRKIIREEYDALRRQGLTADQAKTSLAGKHRRSEHTIHAYLQNRR